jgi:hypothetical protein
VPGLGPRGLFGTSGVFGSLASAFRRVTQCFLEDASALSRPVARRARMSRRYSPIPEETATTNFSWSLAIVLAVYIGLPLAGILLFLSVS